MAGGFKKFIEALNKPIGGSGSGEKQIEKNMNLKAIQILPKHRCCKSEMKLHMQSR